MATFIKTRNKIVEKDGKKKSETLYVFEMPVSQVERKAFSKKEIKQHIQECKGRVERLNKQKEKTKVELQSWQNMLKQIKE